MSRESSLVPTSLLDWLVCASLSPEQKLILLWLWACPYISAAGVGFVPIRPAAASLGLTSEALSDGLANLNVLELIQIDYTTSEIFIKDWFRFHKFEKGIQKANLESAIKKVQSENIKTEVINKSNSYKTTATVSGTATATATKAEAGMAAAAIVNENLRKSAKPKSETSVVIVENPEDQIKFHQLIAEFGAEKIEQVAHTLIVNGKRPYPSSIRKIVAPVSSSTTCGGQAGHAPAVLPDITKSDPKIATAGLAAAKAMLQRRR